jgi:hypothetical protein
VSPDLNAGDPTADLQIRQLITAYEILKVTDNSVVTSFPDIGASPRTLQHYRMEDNIAFCSEKAAIFWPKRTL